MERYSKPLAHHELYLPCYYLLLVDKVGFEPTRFLGIGFTVRRYQPLTHSSIILVDAIGIEPIKP